MKVLVNAEGKKRPKLDFVCFIHICGGLEKAIRTPGCTIIVRTG